MRDEIRRRRPDVRGPFPRKSARSGRDPDRSVGANRGYCSCFNLALWHCSAFPSLCYSIDEILSSCAPRRTNQFARRETGGHRRLNAIRSRGESRRRGCCRRSTGAECFPNAAVIPNVVRDLTSAQAASHSRPDDGGSRVVFRASVTLANARSLTTFGMIADFVSTRIPCSALMLCLAAAAIAGCSTDLQPVLPRHARIETPVSGAPTDELRAVIARADVLYLPADRLETDEQNGAASRLLNLLQQSASEVRIGWANISAASQPLFEEWNT